MTETITTPFETKFGKFAATDKATYKKLKRINHLLHQVARPWADRWARAQYRLPHNRTFRLKGKTLTCKDSWLFAPFYTPKTESYREWTGGHTYRNATRITLAETPLLAQFRADYQNARHPKDTAEAVQPLTLTAEQIDTLLAQIEEFAREAR